MIFLRPDDATSPAVVALAVPSQWLALTLVGNATTPTPIGLHLLIDGERVPLSNLVRSNLAALVADPSLLQRLKVWVYFLAVLSVLFMAVF
jgi:hypothetical protein